MPDFNDGPEEPDDGPEPPDDGPEEPDDGPEEPDDGPEEPEPTMAQLRHEISGGMGAAGMTDTEREFFGDD
ncbi:MAG: hypothetical protein WC869_00105 [Phycisphaerae bacterium]|jgi:hypothetical protein